MRLELPKPRDHEGAVWYSTAASTRFPTHWHDELELNIVLRGGATYDVDDGQYGLVPGALIWFAPRCPHTLVDVTPDLAMWVASFRASAVDRGAALSGLRVIGPGQVTLRRASPAAIEPLSRLCAGILLARDAAQLNPQLGSLLIRAASLTFAQTSAGPTPELHLAVARATELLTGDGAALSLPQVARKVGLSPSRLSRLFKQRMGLSLVQFRNHHLVQRFIVLFGDGRDRNALDLALEVGFGSYPQFHRAFRQVTGYSPAEHVRRVRAGIIDPTPQGAVSSGACDGAASSSPR